MQMPTNKQKSGFKILLQHIYRHKKYVGWGVLSLLGVDVLQVTVPRITQYVIDQLTKNSATYQKLFICGGGIIVIALIIGIFRFLWRYFLVGASRKIEREIRQDIYNHLQILSPEFYDKQKVGDITAHATNDVQAIQRSAGFGTLAAFDAVVLGTLSIANMIYTSPSLALITLLPLPIVTLVVIKFGKLVHFRFDKVQNAFSKLTEKAQETISGIRVVKAYGDEKTEQKYFTEKAENCADENIKLAKIQAVFDPAISGLAMVSLALLLWFGGKRVITGQLSIGEFVAFASYIGMLTWPMIAIGVVVNLVQRGAASMERVQSIIDTKPTINDGDIDVKPSSNIKCCNLNFTYPGTDVEVLKNINFEIKVRDMVFADYNIFNLDSDLKGVVVKEVEPGGWGAVGGILPGDIIQSIDGVKTETVDDARAALESMDETKPEEVVFFVWRDSKTLFINIKTDW